MPTLSQRAPGMKSRQTILALTCGLALIISFTNMIRPFNNVLDSFLWLGYLLVMVLIVLWPKTGKDTRAERAAVRGNWADRIDFERSGGSGAA